MEEIQKIEFVYFIQFLNGKILNESPIYKRYVIIVAFSLILATVPHLSLRRLWEEDVDFLYIITILEMIYTIFLLSLFISLFSKFWYSTQVYNKKIILTLNLITVSISILLSNYFHYQNYAALTGKANDPDPGTKLLNILVPAIGILIFSIYSYRSHRKFLKTKA